VQQNEDKNQMSPDEQTDAFASDMYQVIQRYQQEFDVPVETMIGVLEFIKNELLNGASVEFEIDEDLEGEI
jgi:hypothetical protein